MSWVDDIKSFLNQSTQDLGDFARMPAVASGFSPQIPEDIYSLVEGQAGTPTEDEINKMLGRVGGLSSEDQARLSPYMNVAFGGTKDGRRMFNFLDQSVSGYEQAKQVRDRNAGIAAGLKDFNKNMMNDPLFKNLRETISTGMNTDVIDQKLLDRLINQSTDQFMQSGQAISTQIGEEAAARGIYGSGKALEDTILAKANLRGQATNAETNIRSGAAVENAKSKQNYATIGSGFESSLAGIQGTLDNAAAALLAGSPNPFVDIQSGLDRLTGIGEAEGQLKFLNQSSSANAVKDLLSLITGGAQSGIENTMGLLSLLRKPSGGGGGSSGSSNALLGGLGSGLGSVGTAGGLKLLGF